MKSTKQICLVLPSLHPGGMERVMSELSCYFSQINEIETHLVLLIRSEKFYSIPENIIIHEPKFIFNKKHRVINILKTISYLRSTIKKIKPESILSFGEMYNSFVLLSTLFIKTKVYVSDRSKPDKKWGRVQELIRRVLYKRAHGIISQTTYSKLFLTNEIGHRNITIIPNPVSPFQNNNVEKKNIILNVGRLIPTKRIDILLKIFSLTSHDGWELWIVGDGPERDILENIAYELGVDSVVKFWGNQKDINVFYEQAKIFAFTSVSEGFPNSLLEALASGMSCISFNCIAGPSDLIEDGYNGFLIPVLDLEKFRDCLDLLMKDEELQKIFSKNSKFDAKKYNINNIGQEYLKFIIS